MKTAKTPSADQWHRIQPNIKGLAAPEYIREVAEKCRYGHLAYGRGAYFVMDLPTGVKHEGYDALSKLQSLFELTKRHDPTFSGEHVVQVVKTYDPDTEWVWIMFMPHRAVVTVERVAFD